MHAEAVKGNYTRYDDIHDIEGNFYYHFIAVRVTVIV